MSGRIRDDKAVINRTYTYLFPMLGLASGMKVDNFINFRGIFIKNEDRPEEDGVLHLLLKYSGDRSFIKFESLLRNFSNYRDSYDPDRYHAMFIFDIPEECQEDYYKFTKGKYSQISKEYKDQICKFHGYLDKRGTPGGSILDILYKREAAYLREESLINADLPEDRHIKIPRDQEIGRLLETFIDAETYSAKYKIKDGVEPNNLVNN